MNSSQYIFAWIFWLSFATIFYSYGLYAVLIRSLSAMFGRAQHAPDPEQWPTVSLLICAHNEQEVIEARVRNALESDYPAGKLQIVIASDGSTDRTCEIVRSFADRGVKLIDFAENRGKATTLNESMMQMSGSIVAFSDANTMFERSAVRNLARWLLDPHIAAVCGMLLLTDSAEGKNADGAYWKYETFLKRCEGRLGALLGSNGAIYAIRRDQFIPVPDDTRIDDFLIPLLVRLRHGGRIVYDDRATASEVTAPDLSSEFNRRARIGEGGFKTIGILWPLLNPMRGWVALTFFSHKILRWFCPVLMIAMLLANALLLAAPIYRWIMALQIAFYVCGLSSALVPGRNRILKPLRLAAMFAGMNAALFVGMYRWLKGSGGGAWKPTSRSHEASHKVGIA